MQKVIEHRKNIGFACNLWGTYGGTLRVPLTLKASVAEKTGAGRPPDYGDSGFINREVESSNLFRATPNKSL